MAIGEDAKILLNGVTAPPLYCHLWYKIACY